MVSVTLAPVLVVCPDSGPGDQLTRLVEALRPGTPVIRHSVGQQALDTLQRIAPSLAMIDLNLPDMSGLALLREIRRGGPGSRLPCILISEQVDAASVRAALPYAPAAYLARPIDEQDLKRRLAVLLPEAAATPPMSPLSLDDYLSGLRENNPGGPLLEQVRDATSRCMQSDEQDLNALERLFRGDPQTTARLIHAANSAAARQPTSCQTLSQALARLGVKRSLNLVLRLLIERNAQLADARLAKQAAECCREAAQAAEAAGWLARQLRLDAELCYTAGLLHNLGELAVLRALQGWLDEGGELHERDIERALRGQGAGFGSALRTQWRLPLGLRQLIGAYYAYNAAGVLSREALVLNLTRELLQLPVERDPASLVETSRTVRMLALDPGVLRRVPLGRGDTPRGATTVADRETGRA
ncbi:HDOD domain-containing protein [Stutzerimonas tarimensis]|uniref:HDOD domain-containing protein n=1 Tax=Stutzerimonas tarimensis TaxID=1507735 RepID=A0ABV7T512_9GAMM